MRPSHPVQGIWHGEWDLERLGAITRGTVVEHLGIEFPSIADRSLSARLWVKSNTAQRMGFLQGGASLALAGTVGSIASQCVLRQST